MQVVGSQWSLSRLSHCRSDGKYGPPSIYVRLSPSGLSFFPGSIQLSDIRTLFEKHVKDAKFGCIPSKGPDFKTLKLGVISLWHLPNKHKLTHPETRSAVIQALVVEHDFKRAFQVIQRRSNRFVRFISSLPFWSDPEEAQSFQNKMKQIAGKLSDSEFLQKLEENNDEDLRSAAQTAKALAQTELLSSIDGVVEKLTHAVLEMKREHCGKEAQLQVEKEEREVLNNALVDFIREINRNSDGRQNSYAYLSLKG